MTETKTHTLELDQFPDSGKALLNYAQQNPAAFGLSCLAITAGVVTITVPLTIGFGAAGPVAGEFRMQYSCCCRSDADLW